MDTKQLHEIKKRTARELTDDDYHNLKISDIAKIRTDSKRLVAEVERLEKALFLACTEIARRKTSHTTKIAEESQNIMVAILKQTQEE